MSAFIVSTETMQRVIAAITDNGRIYDGIFGGEYLLRDSSDLDTLGNALFAMNLAAVKDRYPADAEAWGAPVFSYRPLGIISEAERFFAVACLVYQCSEGNIPERPLYKALEEVENSLARKIAHNAANAKKLPWDWPER